MNEPELRPLGPEEVGLLYRRELKGTFPPSELKPLPTIQRHMRAAAIRPGACIRGRS